MASPTMFGANSFGMPYMAAKSPTLSDTVNETAQFRGIYIGTSTTDTQAVSVLMQDGNSVTFSNVKQGTILPVCGQRINSTGTTATNLLILY